MTTGVLLPNGETQFFDLNGEPLKGGLVYMYVPHTTTPKTTWVDQAETTPNLNPIELDPLGRCIIWGNGTYRQLVTDSAGNLIFDQLTSDGGVSTLQSEIDTINGEITTINSEIAALQAAISGQKRWLWFRTNPASTSYQASPTDSATLFTTTSSGGPLTITLPDTSTIVAGWYCALLRTGNPIAAQVFGSASEHILLPSTNGLGQAVLSVATANAGDESLVISFDGQNYEVIEATPATWVALGATTSATPAVLGTVFTSSGVFTIPSSSVKVTVCGGGAGGGGGLVDASFPGSGGGGGGGGLATKWLSGLAVGSTLTVNVGSAGMGGTLGHTGGAAATAGTGGGTSSVVSGTQTISAITAGGGSGGAAGLADTPVGGGAGGVASGGDINSTGTDGDSGATGGPVPGGAQAFGPTAGGFSGCPFGVFGNGGRSLGVGSTSGGGGENGRAGIVVFEYA